MTGTSGISNRKAFIMATCFALILTVGCGRAEPTATPPLPTATPLPPPDTSTAVLPVATPASPAGATASPLPPPDTPTAVPPMATPASPASATAPPTQEGTGGLIAFVSTRDGNGEIYVMNADGGDVRRLTNWRLWDGYPTWSPDGRQIAYYSYLKSKDWVIQVMDVDGGNPRPLTDNGICDGAPHWSPDGTRIAYSSSADCTASHREIYVMNPDGSGQTNVTQNDADDAGSSWSPDGQQMVFSSDRDGDYEIYIMKAGGGNVHQITENDAQDLMAAWSPGANQIAFVSDRDGNDEIYVMDVRGNNVQRLTENAVADWFPVWSPDGSQIVFNSRRDGNLEVYVMDADGGNVRRLTNSPGDDFNAVWQPLPSTWIQTYERDPLSTAQDAVPARDGGYLLVGSTNYTHRDAADEDIHLMKIDAAGQMLWEKTYGGDRFDRGTAVLSLATGGFVILAETESSGAGDRDAYLLHVDQDGNEIWSRTFGGPGMERANAIRQTADGGYILAGKTASFGAGGADLYLVKTDDQGGEVWSRTYGGEHDEEGYAVRQTQDGGFLVLAQATQGEAVYVSQEPDVLLLRTDGLGEELWSRVWTTEEADGGHVLLPTSDGSYLIAGITTPAGNQSKIDVLFVKIDAEGNQIWNKPLGDPNALDYATDALELPGGGYLLTGLFNRSGRGAIPLIRTSADGELVWTRTLLEGRGNKVGMRLLPTADGGYLIVGETDQFRRRFQTVVIKTDSQGNVQE
jgi:Tol biopolymer transport system component